MKITYRKAEAADLDEIQAFVDQAKIVMEKQGIPQWDEVYPILADFDGDLKAGNLFVWVAEGGNLAVTFTISMEQGVKAIRLDTFTLNPYSCALYIIITGASHTEKTLLAQRLLEK